MPEPLFPVRFPKPVEEEVFLLRRPDGTVIAKTRKEIEAHPELYGPLPPFEERGGTPPGR